MPAARHCESPTASETHQFSRISLPHQFQGALVGLELVSTALQLPSANIMQAAAPGLLRYHHHWQQRSQWLRQTIFSELSPSDSHTSSDSHRLSAEAVLILLVGDWLEAILMNKRLQSEPVQLETALSRYQFSSEQRDYYRSSHLILQRTIVLESYILSIQTIASEVNQFYRAHSISAHSISAHSISSHSISSQEARSQKTNLQETDFIQNTPMRLMPAIIGFLAGAKGGIAGIPTLWQMKQWQTRRQTHKSNAIKNEQRILAEQIYKQWLGILV